jgi:hypothetical protein
MENRTRRTAYSGTHAHNAPWSADLAVRVGTEELDLRDRYRLATLDLLNSTRAQKFSLMVSG